MESLKFIESNMDVIDRLSVDYDILTHAIDREVSTINDNVTEVESLMDAGEVSSQMMPNLRVLLRRVDRNIENTYCRHQDALSRMIEVKAHMDAAKSHLVKLSACNDTLTQLLTNKKGNPDENA